MEIKKYSKQTVDNAIGFLYKQARNTSKPKSANEVANQTPEEEGYSISDFVEFDVCVSDRYKSCFIKVFFGKKTFRKSISIYELQKWYGIQYSLATLNIDEDDFEIEEEI